MKLAAVILYIAWYSLNTVNCNNRDSIWKDFSEAEYAEDYDMPDTVCEDKYDLCELYLNMKPDFCTDPTMSVNCQKTCNIGPCAAAVCVDKHEWCSVIQPDLCKDTSMSAECQKTCKVGPCAAAVCVDKHEWCSVIQPDLCKDTSMSAQCQKTCKVGPCAVATTQAPVATTQAPVTTTQAPVTTTQAQGSIICKDEHEFCEAFFNHDKDLCTEHAASSCQAFCMIGPCIPICSPACGVHGDCVGKDTCRCHHGWDGTFCNVKDPVPPVTTPKPDESESCKSSEEEDTSCKCGVPNLVETKSGLYILGGEEVKFARKYPWVVSIKTRQQYHHCGGTIINDRWILTAAHCITDMKTCEAWPSKDKPLVVAVGEHMHHIEGDNSLHTKDYNVKQYIAHPLLICGTSTKNDFALLELTESIPLGDVIRPICLPENNSKDYAGVTATLIGWGQTTNLVGPGSGVLKELQIPIHANDDCKGWHKYFNFTSLNADNMCAYLESNTATSCKGDSGGPLFVFEKDRYVQVGLVSFGYVWNKTTTACDHPEYPNVFARVSTVLEWIEITTASGNKCTR